MGKEISLKASLSQWDDSDLKDELKERGFYVYDEEMEECSADHLEDATINDLIDAIDDERIRLFTEKMDMLNLDQWRAIFNEVERVPKNERKNFKYEYTNLTAQKNG